MKKRIAFFLALLMLTGTFPACSESPETSDTAASTAAPETSDAVDTAEETSAPFRIDSGLAEDVTYDGYTYNILQHIYDHFYAEELTGEPINDADFERIAAVEDKLDIDITCLEFDGDRTAHTKIAAIVQAGTNDYDLCNLATYAACNALLASLIVNLYDVPNLDLTREWWDQYCIEECTFIDKVYFMTGDISVYDNNATFCTYFNKDIAKDYQLPNFYDMVDNGTWTLENFKKQAEAVNADLDYDKDGNHTNDIDDIYGVWIWDDAMMGLINASDIKCCTVNKETGAIELTLMSERFIDAFSRITSFAFDLDVTCAYQRNGYEGNYGPLAFREGRGLFLLQYLGTASSFREMEDEFGILPMPKFDEEQERYISSAASFHLPLYMIPRMTYGEEGYARNGHITQMLAYESMYTMTPAYYEQTLQHKVSRDEESARMLDLIFASRSFDFGWYFEIGSYNSTLVGMLRNYTSNFTSTYQANVKNANKILAKYNTTIEKLRHE